MANIIKETLQAGTEVIIKDEMGNLLEATVIKRTKTGAQITTAYKGNGREIRWAAGYTGEPKVYGNSGYGRTCHVYMPDSEQVAHLRKMKVEAEFDATFRAAFSAANSKHPNLEAVKALQELLPAWIEREEARKIKRETEAAEYEAMKLARGWNW